MWRRIRRAGLAAGLAGADTAARIFSGAKPYSVLKIALGGELREQGAERGLLSFGRRASTDYFALLSLLRWAREDPQLQGILLSIEDLQAGWAKIQGLRRALQRAREAGKRVWVHLASADLKEYVLATAGDRVLIGPSGVLHVAGLSAEATFFLDALQKLGVQADVIQIGRFKSAAEPFTRREMSPGHREMMEALVDDLYDQMTLMVAEARRLEPAAVRDLLGRGPFVAREAVEARLVDGIGYLDQAEEELCAACGSDEAIEQPDYQRRRGRFMRRRALRSRRGTIALVHLSGAIKSGESLQGPDGASAAGATTIAAELDGLRERSDVAAVVLRVDSPGGSGLASDLIWRAVQRLRATKPVVISLGDTAASGGYYVAAAGAPILAEPGTITGSIGVLAGRATLTGLYEHLGISKDTVSRGEHAAIHSDYLPLGPAAREKLEAGARSFYDDFLAKVADGRQMSIEAVAAVAEGRVWTGRQAIERGLVDQFGGVEDAVDEAKSLAGIPRSELVPVERMPRPSRFWKVSFNLLPAQGRAQALLPWLGFVQRERVWAVLPFRLRFF